MASEGVSLPLIHEHLMVRGNYLGKGDCCGRFESITDGFYSKSCDFFVHKKCSESAEYIEHPSHSDHILQLRRINPNHFCNLCARRIVTLFYRCQECDFDIDLYCVSNPPPEVIQLTPSHKLILLKKRSDFDCYAKCGKNSKREYAYKCHDCDIAFHVDCVWHRLEVKHPLEVKPPLEANNEKAMNDWAELRKTLAVMQENIQATIHSSIQELTAAVLQQREQYPVSNDDVPVVELKCGVCCDSGAGQHRDREDRRWGSGFKLDIPEFHGGVKGEEILDWLVVAEEILEFKEVPEDRKVALVATKFRGKAAIWWLQLKATRSRAGKEKIKSWEKLQKSLRKSFLPYNFDRTMLNRFENVRQGARSVDEYADEFSLLLTRNEIFDSELQLVSRFIGGLRPIIRSAMTQSDPTTVAKAYTGALAFEQQLKSSSSAWSTGTNPGGGMASFPVPETWQQEHSEENPSLFQSQTDTVSYDQTVWSSSPPKALCCFSCGGLGHLQMECPKQERRGFQLEEPNWDMDEHVDTEEELPEDLTYGDNSSLLMLRNVCLAPVVMEEPWLCTNVFQSTCTIKEKVCRFVIDSGSSRNVIAEEAVRKLGLKREEHPAPYKLTWLKEGIEVCVEHRSLVSFSIGNHYKDKAYCDVVPMDVSHLILGRPWQYDRGVMHDGRSNSHSFVFENRKIVLLPSPVLPSPSIDSEGE